MRTGFFQGTGSDRSGFLDFVRRPRELLARLWLPVRIPPLPKLAGLASRILQLWQRSALTPKPVASGLATVILGTLLGLEAATLTGEEAIKSWETARFPSPRALDAALGAAGIVRVTDSARIQRTARSLPALMDSAPMIWLSSDQNWVAVVLPRSEPSIRIYCRRCDSPPPGWSPAGSGWQGFERTLERLERLGPPIPLSRTKRPEPRDPREIRY